MPTRPSHILSNVFVFKDSESTRSEIRQFLLAVTGIAFVLAALGAGQVGADAFAKDIILVFCGGWCANQLIRGSEIFKSQVICVLQAYLIGVMCCALLLFAVGWFVFLPWEYKNLGHGLLLAATFTTNIGQVFFPIDTGMRFDGLFDHLWLPALIAQCGLILTVLYRLLAQNTIRLLLALGGLAAVSLVLSLINTPMVQRLPIGGLWAFLFGAIPFIIINRFRVLDFATLIGVINVVAGVLAITAYGDTVLSRALVAFGLAFLYLGSRPHAGKSKLSASRRRWSGMVLHTFLWAVPLLKLNAGLSLSEHSQLDLVLLLMPCLLFSIFSWSIWQHVEQRSGTHQFVVSGIVATILLINGAIGLTTQGAKIRFPDAAQAYLHALEADQPVFNCPRMSEGPLAGLEVCKFGPEGPPAVLVWGDHQLDSIRVGFAEAARRANVPTILIAQPNCVPLDGLQSRFPAGFHVSGQECDRQSAQVVQALPHLKSLRQVTLVADWAYYLNIDHAELRMRPKVRIGPLDGSPFDVMRQSTYIAEAIENTLQSLTDRGLRVSVLRQAPAQPRFDAELAARSSLPGASLYMGMPDLAISVPATTAQNLHADVDDLFRTFAVTGKLTYVDTWSAFCSETRCDARGGLSSDYISSTRLSPTGALSLAPILATDLKRALTHTPYRRFLDS